MDYAIDARAITGLTDNWRLEVERDKIPTRQAERILEHHLPAWLALFLEKNRKYAGIEKNELGVRGKFVDVFRKTGILKSRLWDGAEVVGEDTPEVIMDMIGHLFLMLDDLEREQI